jgi:hypothetical protein
MALPLAARLAGGIALAVTVAGCGFTEVVTPEPPDPAAIPSGPIEAHGEEPTGPIVEVGSGQLQGIGWRYVVYPAEEGWCTQLETPSVVTSACGDPVPAGDQAFGSVGHGDGEGDTTAVDGIVSADTATVWLIGEGGRRSPATLMSLEEAGLEAQAFVGFAPPGVTLTHLQAVAWNGRVLETYELP